METVIDRFLRYVKIDTMSSEESMTSPSTEKQKVLGRLLRDELVDIGASDVYFDEEYGYVYAKIPGNLETDGKPLGFLSHMDTSPETSGANVKPRFVEHYDGENIILNKEQNIVLQPAIFPELKNYVGKTLIVTDGTTLLGADDKAGIAEIMTMADILLHHSELKHGEISIAFTPDEEIGAGVDHIDLKQFGADYAYTVDGGAIGELEYENFNAASAVVEFHGLVVHPGEAKDRMVNASLCAMEFAELLPKEERPEHTSGREGFFHLTDMSGTVEYAKLHYIIRDHDREKFEAKKQLISQCVETINKIHGEGTAIADVQDSYYNMREIIEPDYMFLVQHADKSMRAAGMEPKYCPIRGGTDGARLSFEGVPCPNLCTGGHNFHGRYEYICKESMEHIVEMLVNLATSFAEGEV